MYIRTIKEIDSKLKTIIAFSELEEFIDMPVQNYSSGMKVRLGFAVAAQMEPDILIIDEVLAVGDLGFILKCFKTIDTILPKTAVIFVSHSMPMVSRICTQIILMEGGAAKFQGTDVGKAIDLYYTRFTSNEINTVFSDGSIKLDKVEMLGAGTRNNILQLPHRYFLNGIKSKENLIFNYKKSSDIKYSGTDFHYLSSTATDQISGKLFSASQPEKNISNEFKPSEIFKASDMMVDSLTNLLARERSKKDN